MLQFPHLECAVDKAHGSSLLLGNSKAAESGEVEYLPNRNVTPVKQSSHLASPLLLLADRQPVEALVTISPVSIATLGKETHEECVHPSAYFPPSFSAYRFPRPQSQPIESHIL